MSNSILQIVTKSACLNILCLALTFSCAAAERPDFSGTWKLYRLERDGLQQSGEQVISKGSARSWCCRRPIQNRARSSIQQHLANVGGSMGTS